MRKSSVDPYLLDIRKAVKKIYIADNKQKIDILTE